MRPGLAFLTTTSYADPVRVLLAGVLLALGGLSHAGPVYQVLHNFLPAADGKGPIGQLAVTADGHIYGTTRGGIQTYSDTVYRVGPDGSFVVLYRFEGAGDTVGRSPNGLILASDNNLYGTTREGGLYGDGTVYRITPEGITTPLLRLYRNELGPYNLQDTVTQGSDGLLYGMATSGGERDRGALFRLATDGSAYQVLRNFRRQGRHAGIHPVAAPTQASDGVWFGTTSEGSRWGCGAVFNVSTKGLNTLYAFKGINSGKCYQVGSGSETKMLEGSGGNLYGTTVAGGAQNAGTIFRLSPSGNVKILHHFATAEKDCQRSESALALGPDGAFYGTCSPTGLHGGLIYRISPTGRFKVVFELPADQGEGWGPTALTLGPDGRLYGTTVFGGLFGGGVVFRLTL